MVITRVLSIFFFIAAIVLAGVLIRNIKSKIDEDKRIERQENLVINKLKMIRDAQVAYLATNGKYTGNFDTLISFIDTGRIYLTQRSEEIEMLAYGQEKITVFIDTIGEVSVKDSLFVVRDMVKSLANGTLQDLNMTVGGEIKRGDVIATVISSTGKSVRVRAQQNALVERVYTKEGQQVNINQDLARIAYPRINDIKQIPYLPESKSGEQFSLFADKILKGNVRVDVFEARDTRPVNVLRRKNQNERALRVGSRTEPSVSGNWE